MAAVEALRGRESLGRVTASYGLRSTGKVDDGEEFYFAAAIHLGPSCRGARSLANGAVSAPVETPDGPVILIMLHNRPPVPETFEQPTIRAGRLQPKSLMRLERRMPKFLRNRAEIKLAPEAR